MSPEGEVILAEGVPSPVTDRSARPGPQGAGRKRRTVAGRTARKPRSGRRRGGAAARVKRAGQLPAQRRSRQRAGRRGRQAARKRVPAALQAGTAPSVIREQHAVSVEEAYERGRYEGGERLLEQAALPGHSLADLTLPEVIAAGVEAMRHRLVPLLDAAAVCTAVETAIASQQPISVVRLGDGELLALAQETVYDADYIRREAPFLPQAGIAAGDHAARERLADAVRRATIVGVPLSRMPHFGPLLAPALAGNGIDMRTLRLTESTVNYSFYLNGLLDRLLRGRRILVIGNSAHRLAVKLAEAGYLVTGAITPVSGFTDIDRVAAEAAAAAGAYDLALVAAGIPAVVIASHLAFEHGKAAVDFGHLADQIADGQVKLN